MIFDIDSNVFSFTLSKYKFSICFENSITAGYISEKIFDCFYAGTIPIYYGDPNVKESIDPDSFIDFRKFDDYIILSSI